MTYENYRLYPELHKITFTNFRNQYFTVEELLKERESRHLQEKPREFRLAFSDWSVEQRSRFVESLIVGQPHPAFFIDGSLNQWYLIDGEKRLRAISRFVSDAYRLCGLFFLGDKYEGRTFSELPLFIRRKIMNYVFEAYILNPGSSPQVRYGVYTYLLARPQRNVTNNCRRFIFPEGFDGMLVPSLQNRPNVAVRYNSADSFSLRAYNSVTSIMDAWEDGMSGIFDINAGESGDISTAQEAAGSYYAMLLPFLILTFLYSACMGIAPESIAGEKERGTIATLLVTPVGRGELVVGKIAALSVLSALSAIGSFIGTFLSMPKLMGGSIGDMFSAYSAGAYFALFAVMLSAVLLIVSLISILSAFAKSVKEATTFAVPVMILVMLLGLSSMLFGTVLSWPVCLIPVYNCVQVMSQIFSMQFSPLCLLVTLLSNAVYIVLLVLVLTKMFKSEKIMFNK